ncbi:hypothetical protein KAU45_08690 [bacterium]|nr:hypothetical protein [bacterium]
MRRFMILALFIALVFGFTGCGEETEEEEEAELDLSTIENAVDAFIEVVGDKDKDALKNMVIDESYFDALWPLIDELGLTIIGGYELEEGAFGTTVTFEDARYVEDGWDYVLELTFSEDKGKWLISGYLTMLAPSDGDDEEETEDADETAALEEAALEYLKATYTDAVKAVSDNYAGGDFGGDVQYYIHFVDGKFDKVHSVATGYGDDRAYNNEEFRAEMDALVETFEVDVPGEVNVFWVMEFPF